MSTEPIVVEEHIRHANGECVEPVLMDTWDNRYATDSAATIRQEWQRYANTRKKNMPGVALTSGDFTQYIAFWYTTDIRA